VFKSLYAGVASPQKDAENTIAPPEDGTLKEENTIGGSGIVGELAFDVPAIFHGLYELIGEEVLTPTARVIATTQRVLEIDQFHEVGGVDVTG